MFTWGILSAACAFITGPKSFFVIRFLLGVAEAGFFPGVVLYFTYCFPDRYRGRIIAALFLAVPGANALANVVSGAILEMNESSACEAGNGFFSSKQHQPSFCLSSCCEPWSIAPPSPAGLPSMNASGSKGSWPRSETGSKRASD
jgi:MFS family permease